jgi:hypothetical protein
VRRARTKKPDPRILRTRPELGGLIIDDASYADIVKWAGESAPEKAPDEDAQRGESDKPPVGP